VAETATHRSGGPKRPLLRIADIFRRHPKALEAKHTLNLGQRRLLDGSAFQPVAGLYLFSGEAMGILLRGKMMAALREYQAKGSFPERDDRTFNELMAGLARHLSWVVHAEAPFRDPSHLLNYLGRYVHRIALSDSRLVEATPERVTFTTRDGNTASMHPVRFMHRFLQHVLPQGFHKVRHGGLYASTRKGGRLDQARALLEREVDPEEAARWKRDTAETMERLVFEGHPCPDCGGVLERTNVRIPGLRAPPGGRDV